MKITNLKVTGFRSLKDVDWHPGDLNIIIGPNASGKSNLLDLFEMLSRLPYGKLGDYVQSRGGISSLLWDGQAEGIDLILELGSSPNHGQEPGVRLRYILGMRSSGPLASYEITNESLIREQSGQTHAHVVVDADLHVPRQDSDRSGRNRGARHEESCLSDRAALADDSDRSSIAAHIETWRVHRIIDTSLDAAVRAAPVARYEKLIENDGSNLISVLHTQYTEDRAFAQRINAAMEAAFEHFDRLVFPPSPVADQRVQMKVRWKNLSRDCPVWDLSDGTLRFLYLMAILAKPDPPSLIAIDEPETGLHPRMMGIVAECAMDAATRTQLVLTTHSPEFLDAFRDTQPTITVAELVNGATKLTVKAEDDLAYWLKEYTLGDLFRSGELESVD